MLTLIAALPASTTRSIANQFEIVSLIFIRDVFKDIAAASDLVTQHQLTLAALPAFFDMWGGILMFFLVGVFQHVAQRHMRPSGTAIPSRGAARFIAQKKVVSIGLGALLLGMAVYNIGLLAVAIYSTLQTGHGSRSRRTEWNVRPCSYGRWAQATRGIPCRSGTNSIC